MYHSPYPPFSNFPYEDDHELLDEHAAVYELVFPSDKACKRVGMMTLTSGFTNVKSHATLASFASSKLYLRRACGACHAAKPPSTPKDREPPAERNIFRRPKSRSISGVLMTLPPSESAPNSADPSSVKLVIRTMDGYRAQKPAPLVPPFDPSAGWHELSMIRPVSEEEDFDEDDVSDWEDSDNDEDEDEDSEPGSAYSNIFTPTPTSGAFTATPLTSARSPSHQHSTHLALPKLVVSSLSGSGSPLQPLAAPKSAALSPQSAMTPSRMRSALLHRLTNINRRAYVDSPYPVSDEEEDDAYMSDPGSAAALEYSAPAATVPSNFARFAVQRGRQAPFPVRSMTRAT